VHVHDVAFRRRSRRLVVTTVIERYPPPPEIFRPADLPPGHSTSHVWLNLAAPRCWQVIKCTYPTGRDLTSPPDRGQARGCCPAATLPSYHTMVEPAPPIRR